MGMPGGGGGRKDMVVVQDVRDERTVQQQKRVSTRCLPRRLKRRLKCGGRCRRLATRLNLLLTHADDYDNQQTSQWFGFFFW